jgi:DnaK suppressor protein
MKKLTIVKTKKEEGTVEKVKSRYSDEELEEFRQIILSKLEKAHNDLKLLTESYTTGNDHDTNDTSPTFKVLEEGYQVFSKEENSKFAARQSKFIKALENALIRIENKSYGICRATGKLIPKDRLRIVPHATLSIEAKRQQTTAPMPPMQASHNF